MTSQLLKVLLQLFGITRFARLPTGLFTCSLSFDASFVVFPCSHLSYSVLVFLGMLMIGCCVHGSQTAFGCSESSGSPVVHILKKKTCNRHLLYMAEYV